MYLGWMGRFRLGGGNENTHHLASTHRNNTEMVVAGTGTTTMVTDNQIGHHLASTFRNTTEIVVAGTGAARKQQEQQGFEMRPVLRPRYVFLLFDYNLLDHNG